MRNYVVEAVIGDCRKDGHHALMIFARYLVDALYGDALRHNSVEAYQFVQLVYKVAVQILLDIDLVDVLACFDGFHDGAYAEYVFIAFHIYRGLERYFRLFNIQ